MMRENIMNGTMPDENDNYGIGVGVSKRYMEVFLNATTDKRVKVEHNFANCILDWESIAEADRYRVDLYRPDDRGPNCGDINYVCTESEFTEITHYETAPLEAMASYYAIVFAYKGKECIARYPSVFCIISPTVVGDMLKDDEDDFVTGTSDVKNGKLFKYQPLPAEKSSLLLHNPERGFRSEEDYFIPAVEDMPDWSDEDYYNDVIRRLTKNVYNEPVTVSRVYFILDKYLETETLPKEVFDYMQGYYNAYRRLGIKIYLGHYYQHGCARENVSDRIVIGHVKQLSSLFQKNADVIYLFCMNFIGAYGEWTCMRKPMDYQLFVNSVLEAAPEQLRLAMRQPIYKQRFVNPKYFRYNRIGFANEALHGLRYPHIDIGQSFVQPGSQWWNVTMKEGAYTINDAEPFTTRAIRMAGTWSTGISNIEALSQQRTCTLSVQHSYGDICQFGGDIDQTLCYSWKGQEITEQMLDNLGIAYNPAWFINQEGDKVKRNTFEFIRDHLGYRISAKNLTLSEKDGELHLSLNLKNFGFAAAFNLVSGFALLDENANVIREVSAGDPENWYCTNPDNYNDREYLTHRIEAKMPLDGAGERFSIGFYIRNSLSQYARMDNSIEFKNGYHILCNIKN